MMNVPKNIKLWEDMPLDTEGINDGCPSITPYLLEGEGPYPVILVCPGGGYVNRANHEGEPIAQWLNKIGVSALVLNYRVAPHAHPVQLEEAQRAIRLIRYHAAEWRLDANRVGILGFSAGGHLASMTTTCFDAGQQDLEDPVDLLSCRPDIAILCYPVITMAGEHAHAGSQQALSGPQEKSAEWLKSVSSEQRITADTPPAFLWHTANDASVPVENSLMFAAGLRQYNIPFELHIFEDGRHGLGLAEAHPQAQAWPELCHQWLRRRSFIPEVTEQSLV